MDVYGTNTKNGCNQTYTIQFAVFLLVPINSFFIVA